MSNLQLFKESITLTDYDVLINELASAIDSGTSALIKLLFGTEAPDLYANHGVYQHGNHKHCAGLSSKRYTEKRLCKCMYILTVHIPNAVTSVRFGIVLKSLVIIRLLITKSLLTTMATASVKLI